MVNIGVWEKYSDRLAISVHEEKKKEEEDRQIDYFETNAQGEIIWHSKNTLDHELNLNSQTIMLRTGGDKRQKG